MANLEQEVGFKTFRALPPIHVLVKRAGFFFCIMCLFIQQPSRPHVKRDCGT